MAWGVNVLESGDGSNANEEKPVERKYRSRVAGAHTAPRLGDTRPFLCKRKWTWVARVTAAGARPSKGRYDHVDVTDSFHSRPTRERN